MSWWQRLTGSEAAPPRYDESPSFWPMATPSPARPSSPAPVPPLPAASSPAADDQLVLPLVPPGTRPPTFVDRVDVNAATAGELTVLPGLTPAGVARAVDLRDLGGPFADVDEFFTAAGVDPADQPRLSSLLACHPPHRPYDRSAPYVPETRILDV